MDFAWVERYLRKSLLDECEKPCRYFKGPKKDSFLKNVYCSLQRAGNLVR